MTNWKIEEKVKVDKIDIRLNKHRTAIARLNNIFLILMKIKDVEKPVNYNNFNYALMLKAISKSNSVICNDMILW